VEIAATVVSVLFLLVMMVVEVVAAAIWVLLIARLIRDCRPSKLCALPGTLLAVAAWGVFATTIGVGAYTMFTSTLDSLGGL